MLGHPVLKTPFFPKKKFKNQSPVTHNHRMDAFAIFTCLCVLERLNKAARDPCATSLVDVSPDRLGDRCQELEYKYQSPFSPGENDLTDLSMRVSWLAGRLDDGYQLPVPLDDADECDMQTTLSALSDTIMGYKLPRPPPLDHSQPDVSILRALHYIADISAEHEFLPPLRADYSRATNVLRLAKGLGRMILQRRQHHQQQVPNGKLEGTSPDLDEAHMIGSDAFIVMDSAPVTDPTAVAAPAEASRFLRWLFRPVYSCLKCFIRQTSTSYETLPLWKGGEALSYRATEKRI